MADVYRGGFLARLFGRRDPAARDWSPAPGYVIRTSLCGGVVLGDGEGRKAPLVMILLPVDDPAICDAPPTVGKGVVEHLIVCNGGEQGFLAASAIGRKLGVDRVLAIAADRPVDRGREEAAALPIAELPKKLSCGSLTVGRLGKSVFASWTNGPAVQVGDAVAPEPGFDRSPDYIFGRVDVRGFRDSRQFGKFLGRIQRVVVLSYVPGVVDPDNEARTYSELGKSCSVVSLG